MNKLVYFFIFVSIIPIQSVSQESDSLEVAMERLFSGMFGGSEVNVNQIYSFDHSIVYRITKRFEGVDDISEEQNIQLMFSEGNGCIGIEFEEERNGETAMMRGIFDPVQRAMINLIETKSEKAGMTVKLPAYLNKNTKEMNLTKMSENVNIHGEICTRYFMEPNDETIEIWASNESKIDFTNTLKSYFQMTSLNIERSSIPRGLMMKSTITSAGPMGNSIKTMELISMHLNDQKIVNTEPYTFIDLTEDFKREMKNSME